jgi:putative transposase
LPPPPLSCMKEGSECLAPVAWNTRQKMVSKNHKLSVRRQCALMTLTRSNLYYEPKGESAENPQFMDIMHCPLGGMRRMIPRGDKQFLETPWYGSRQMARHMKRNNHPCGRHRARPLMRLMRLVPIYQEPNTSKRHPQLAGGSKVSMDGAYEKKVTEQTGFRPRSAHARFG